MENSNFYNQGQSLVRIIVVLVIVSLIGGGLYFYLSKQIPEVPEIHQKPTEEVTKPGLESKCIRIFGKESGKKKMNIFFVGVDYPENKLLYNKNYNLNDYSPNLENDIFRILYNDSYEIGYGLLTIEPFVSNLDKINIFLVNESIKADWENSGLGYFSISQIADGISRLLLKHCAQFLKKEDVVGVILAKDHPLAYKCCGASSVYIAGTGLIGFGAIHRAGIGRDYRDTVSTFVHEIGHAFGLHDLYDIVGYPGSTPVPMDTTSIPNCDSIPGCPKWCDGPPKPSYKSPCSNYNENECKQHSVDQNCLWLTRKHPYFGTQCIRSDSGGYDEQGNFSREINIGTDCLLGTGCYFGCGGAGWRPVKPNDFVIQRIDTTTGKKHAYEPVSERFIKEIFECCFPQDCKNYNSVKCSDFARKYPKYSSCNVCSQ